MKYLRSNGNKKKTVGRVRIQRLLQGALGPKEATRKKPGLLLEGGCPASSVKWPCPALCPEAKHRWGQWRNPCYILAAGKSLVCSSPWSQNRHQNTLSDIWKEQNVKGVFIAPDQIIR